MSARQNLEDFLSDDEFVRWVKNPDKELDSFWSKWMSYHPDKRQTVSLAREIILGIQVENLSEDQGIEDLQNDILKNILLQEGKSKGNSRHFKPRAKSNFALSILKYAAVICIGVAIYFIANSQLFNDESDAPEYQTVIKENDIGRRQTLLPDGTKVWMNSNTRISYASNINEADQRKVILEGEAYFKVKKDPGRPFIVQSKSFSTTALGTAFNVNAYPDGDNIVVSLEEGKVLIKQDDKKADSYVLTPGHQLTYSILEKKLGINPFNSEVELGWIKGILSFKDADFDEICKRLEKFYSVKIEVKGEKPQWKYSGRFENASLEQVIERVASVEKINYQLNDKTLVIWN